MGAKLGLLGLFAVALTVMAGCGQPNQQATAPPATAMLAPPHGPPEIAQPYHFGDIQAKAPPIVNGMAPIVRRIPTDKRYVFITIDDGEVRQPDAPGLIKQSGLRPTMFLTQRYIRGHEDYFREIRDDTGAVIEDHTITHPNLRGKPYALQRKEICDNADDEAKEFGIRPTLFRPPYGNYDSNTLKAAADCGMKAVVLWTAAVNDGVVQFQRGDHLNPGDIVLMHFRTTFVADYTAFLERAKRDGLTPVPLPDFLA